MKAKSNLDMQKILSKVFSKTENKFYEYINIFGLKISISKRKKVEEKYLKLCNSNHKLYKKVTFLLFDCLLDEKVECIDAYSLFEYMRSKNLKAYYIVLKNSKLYKELKEKNKIENIITIEKTVRENYEEFYEKIYPLLLETKAVITSFGENRLNKFFKKIKHLDSIFIQHGAAFFRLSLFENGYFNKNKFDKVLVSFEKEYQIFRKYGFKDKNLIKSGLPRWDLLNEQKEQEKSILIMLTWRKSLNEMNFNNSFYRKKLLSLLNNKDLIQFLKEKNVNLYFAQHHAFKYSNNIDFKIENENIKTIEMAEISKYIKKCNMLLTDFSSVACDFMFQEKPAILYILDRFDNNITGSERKDLTSFDYKKKIIPNVYFDEKEVIETIKKYVENDFKLENSTKKVYNDFFYIKKDIRKDLTEKIEKPCGV